VAERTALHNGIWLCQICARLIDADPERFPVEVLLTWKAEAELTALQELGKARGPQADALDPSSPAAEVYAMRQKFRSALELVASRETAEITRALFAEENPYHVANENIALQGVSLASEMRAWRFCQMNLSAVVEDLLADLALYATIRDGAYRFVTTNTSVDRVGQSVWKEEEAFRTLVARTASILSKARASFAFWRVFLLRAPAAIVERGETRAFHSILDENLRIGANVAISNVRILPSDLAHDYSDFYCVPGRLAYITVVPMYLLARFDSARRHDRVVVDRYSEISESLLDQADCPGAASMFLWEGGNDTLLREQLLSIA
jgi:hypothetical protein